MFSDWRGRASTGGQTHRHVQKRPGLRKLRPQEVQVAKAALVRALECEFTVTEACCLTQVGRSTFYEWLRRDQDFATLVDNARAPISEPLLMTQPLEGASTRTLISMYRRLQLNR